MASIESKEHPSWLPKLRRATSVDEEKMISSFQDFLRIKTTSFDGPSSGSYQTACDWLVTKFTALGLDTQVVSPVANKPIVLITWKGSNPTLPAILLNSHYDVVPAMLDKWDMDPWAAVRTKEGRIFGRGTQDMKCVCIQYLFAIEKLKKSGYTPLRTIHLSYVPDEEIGGKDGMAALMTNAVFKSWNIALAIDEGLANPDNAFTAFYGERSPWWIFVNAKGPTGHASRFIANTAVSKLMTVANKGLSFRKEQESRLGHTGGCSHAQAKKLGDVTTLNLTVLSAGVTGDGGQTYAMNVIPTEAVCGFDVRISPELSMKQVEEMLDTWCKEAGEGVTWKHADFTSPMQEHYITALHPTINPWFTVFTKGVGRLNRKVIPEIFPAATDSRFLRKLGIPAIGFSPMSNSPILLHEHNEYIDEGVFLEGVEVFIDLINALASTPECSTDKLKSSQSKL